MSRLTLNSLKLELLSNQLLTQLPGLSRLQVTNSPGWLVFLGLRKLLQTREETAIEV